MKSVNTQQSGEKYLPKFDVEVVNDDGKLVARATKTLYVQPKTA